MADPLRGAERLDPGVPQRERQLDALPGGERQDLSRALAPQPVGHHPLHEEEYTARQTPGRTCLSVRDPPQNRVSVVSVPSRTFSSRDGAWPAGA